MGHHMKRLSGLAVAAVLSAYSAGGVAAPWAHLEALETAAGHGDPRAQAELGTRYAHAEGVPKNLEKANQLYCKAAKQGYAEAQYQLGWTYAYGRGVARDDTLAAALFRMAADQGHEYAARALHYVSAQPVVRLPPCLQPDPPVAAASTDASASARVGDESDLPAADGIPKVPPEIERLVRRLAPQYAVDTQLVLAVIAAESAFNAAAVSPKNAQGLMQLIPETAARFGVKKVFNPVDNIKGGLAYLRWLLAFFQGDVPLVVAAYNAGERAVEKYRGIPPYAETRNYVERITRMYRKASHPYEAGIVEPSIIMSASAADVAVKTPVRRGRATP